MASPSLFKSCLPILKENSGEGELTAVDAFAFDCFCGFERFKKDNDEIQLVHDPFGGSASLAPVNSASFSNDSFSERFLLYRHFIKLLFQI